MGNIWAILGRGLEVESNYSEGTFRVNIQHPEAEIGFIAPILHPDSLLTKSLVAYKHDEFGHGKSAALVRPDKFKLVYSKFIEDL